MSETKVQYDDEFKKNAVKLNYASPKTMSQIADDLGIKTEQLYAWRRKYTADGDKTPAAIQNDELKKLRLENAELKIERDMLKKATTLSHAPRAGRVALR